MVAQCDPAGYFGASVTSPFVASMVIVELIEEVTPSDAVGPSIGSVLRSTRACADPSLADLELSTRRNCIWPVPVARRDLAVVVGPAIRHPGRLDARGLISVLSEPRGEHAASPRRCR